MKFWDAREIKYLGVCVVAFSDLTFFSPVALSLISV
jgi:hypothetical protein